MRRRAFLARAGIGGAALASGSAALLGPPPAALAETHSDAAILSEIIQLQQLAVLALRKVLASHQLRRGAAREVRQILAHERMQLAALLKDLASLGSSPPAPPVDVAAADALLAAHHASSRVSSLPSDRECLELLLDVEQLVIGACFDAISTLQSAVLGQRSVQIMASDARHAAVLGQLLTPADFSKIVPTAFVQGKR